MQDDVRAWTTILGLGNILCGDDAFGVCAVEKLYSQYDFPDCVQIVDGGAQGPALCGLVRESRRMLVFDAFDSGEEAGTITIFNNAQIPSWLGMGKISPHQNSFAETLALASLKNELPQEIILVGIQPKAAGFGFNMSSPVRNGIEPAIRTALDILKNWGINPWPAKTEKHLLNAEMRNSICLFD